MSDRELRMLAYLDNCRRIIAEHGWMVQGVFPTETSPGFSFAYTAGLSVAGLPELVVVGLPLQGGIVETFLNALARRALAEEPRVGDRWTVDENPDIAWEFAPVSEAWTRENVTLPGRLYPFTEVTALQVLWPDDAGNYPNQESWTLGRDAQPLLAEHGATR